MSTPGFKDIIAADNRTVFLNTEEFAELRTVCYEDEEYVDIPIVLSGLEDKERPIVTVRDHAQGLYLVTNVLHCELSNLGGNQPKPGSRIKINNREGGGGFFYEFHVASSIYEMGMLRVELEAIDE